MRNYPRLDIGPFGERLLATNDLDPIYVALHGLALDGPTLGRWILAYTCYYSAAVASYAAEREGMAYWSVLRTAAHNVQPSPAGGRWPRGHERRHARGKIAVRMILELFGRYGDRPEDFLDAVRADSCPGVMKKVATHYNFGPWIGFKVADLLERVVGHPVSFDEAAIFMFDDPKKAATLLYARKAGLDPERVRLKAAGLNAVIRMLCGRFERFKAPPRFDRPVGLQEAETVLCKWKSHLNGHYPEFNDIDEIRGGLAPWLDHSDLARRFYAEMPRREA